MKTEGIPVEVSGLIKACIRIERKKRAQLMAYSLCVSDEEGFDIRYRETTRLNQILEDFDYVEGLVREHGPQAHDEQLED